MALLVSDGHIEETAILGLGVIYATVFSGTAQLHRMQLIDSLRIRVMLAAIAKKTGVKGDYDQANSEFYYEGEEVNGSKAAYVITQCFNALILLVCIAGLILRL